MSGGTRVKSLSWMGVRTDRFADMVVFYRDVLGLEMLKDEPSAAWFRSADGTEIHVYGPGDTDHNFFGPGPVVGLWVGDFDETRARMSAAGIQFIGEPQRDGSTAWNHYRGPDGNIYEIMGPDR